ncbi:MAG: SCP2 sterol-binding domain-containing protein [Lewinellaceae bacterium]|nr:SCP2 sterol-binding domain-containing protein [Saprospiraceae bacterium]MCB9341380.1 SCP2 sterol-binding domain-containing protein [Lewinellaceae bacterium]
MDYSKIPKLSIDNARDFLITLPASVKPEWLENVDDTNFHFDIAGDGGGQFSVIVKDKKLEVHEEFVGDPKCKITAKNDNILKLLRGELNPMMAVFTGKLKISNTGEVMKYAKLFGLM